jgi:hypothetical protein
LIVIQAPERVAAPPLSECFVAANFNLEGAVEMAFKRYVATAGALGILVVMAGAVPAYATIFSKEPFSFQESFEEDLCGIDVRHDVDVSGTTLIRTGKGDLGRAFFGSDHYEFVDMFTNLASGASFTIEGAGIVKDVKATPLGDDVFEFRILDVAASTALSG